VGLAEYRRKRRFDRTPEPAGGKRTRPGSRFCVQKHAASQLHYDFRLEMDGVLVSWAVPKGPSLDPAEKRFAAHVEDHPVEYGEFEGIIPKEQYGGGTVMLWDCGTWEPEGDAAASYRKGRLKFSLHGEKMRGSWALVRMGGERGKDDKNWLLIKHDDEFAKHGRGSSLVDERAESVATGRSMEEIAADADATWDSNRGGKATARAKPRRKSRAKSASRAASRAAAPRRSRSAQIPDVVETRLPAFVEPELATLVDAVPDGDDWLYETKFDGYRILCRVANGEATLLSRNRKDWTDRLPALADAAAKLPVDDALLDGEAVLVGSKGRTSFQAMQNALSEGRAGDVTYFAFDLLHLNGHDIRAAALEERKRVLEKLLARRSKAGPIRYSRHVRGRGGDFFDRACGRSEEGIICKRADAPYRSGRGRDWLRVKCTKGQEVVVVGFTDPEGARTGFGALIVGVHDPSGALRFAGKVGTGFTETSLRELHAKLRKLETAKPPVTDPPRGAALRGVHWVRPKLVAEVGFLEWTRDGRLRHPTFNGLRTDKAPSEVMREREKPVRASAAVRTRPGRTRAMRVATAKRRTADDVAGVRLTHPERVVYPGEGITKLDVARWYEAVAERMLPHVVHRPLTLVRCPQGSGSKCFFQKHWTDAAPSAIRATLVPEAVRGEPAQYMEIDSAAGLVALAQMGALEVHVWGSRVEDLERPDRIVFDLDPDPTVSWPGVVAGALELRERLGDLGLETFVKTTGGKGLHVVVPVRPLADWDETKSFARAIADAVVADSPDRYTANMSKARRTGRTFIDYLRNGRGATAIAPYSTRARPGAPVAMPVEWAELKPKSRPEFTIGNALARVSRSDPWKSIASVRQKLTAAIRKRAARG
jgi:bifunctional non-homologous end joining protein LigD